ncbi:3-methyladenine DNA glycosylase [Nocardia xishanensis]
MIESVLAEDDWRARAAAYQARLDELVGPYLERRAAGSTHPVIDFLFTYYGNKPAQLRRWHPGFGVGLAGAREYEGARGYRRISADLSGPVSESNQVGAHRPLGQADTPVGSSQVNAHAQLGQTDTLEPPSNGHTRSQPGQTGASEWSSTLATDHGPVFAADPAYLARRRDTLEFVANLLRATASRPAQLSCFGLHEWAMVYRTDDVRHRQVPLRLGAAGTDAVVEAMSLRCTHFDAFRFFTPDAVGRNAKPLTRADQVATEQPGCLHANMDLYKWSFKLVPLVSSTLVLDCFELACAARELDMRASPYDLGDYGYTPIPIETPSGRAEYVRRQAELAERAATLRATLLAACEELLTVVVEHAVG